MVEEPVLPLVEKPTRHMVEEPVLPLVEKPTRHMVEEPVLPLVEKPTRHMLFESKRRFKSGHLSFFLPKRENCGLKGTLPTQCWRVMSKGQLTHLTLQFVGHGFITCLMVCDR
ncbi:uncharacterized protein LOC128186086 [Crassostrea angulata]|uniref:uncharacterized protein LOC128186086 n=1 Tax=Magallana angulata TaxID=2784310 RepID=UPI0022B1BA7B|nr:uncharacterized protein LOC128186086 [Crassostrea angulata]